MPDGSLDACGRERQTARRTRERYAEIRERPGAGQPIAAIRRATGLDRRTVQRYARAASADELLAGISRESKLDQFKPYICQRWNQGLTRRHPDPRRACPARLGRQPADRPPVRPPAPAGRAGRHARPGRAENPRDHPLAAVTPRQPRRRRPGPARRGQGRLPAPGRPGRAHPGLRRDDDPPAGPARTRRLAHPGRSRRPARTPLTRRRHPARPGRRHRRPGPALPLRRHGRKRQARSR